MKLQQNWILKIQKEIILEGIRKMDSCNQFLKNIFGKEEKYAVPLVRICVECGSILVFIDEKGITCKSCGFKKKFKKIS